MDEDEATLHNKKLQIEAMQKELVAQENVIGEARMWCDKFERANAEYLDQMEKTNSLRKQHVALTEKMEQATEAAATSDGCPVGARVVLLRQAEVLVEEHERLTASLKASVQREHEKHNAMLEARVEATMHSKAEKGVHAETSEDEATMKASIMQRLKDKAMKTMHAAEVAVPERNTLQEVEQAPEEYEQQIRDMQEKLRIQLEEVSALEKQEAEAAKNKALEEEKKKESERKKAIEEQRRKAEEEEAQRKAIEVQKKAEEEEAKRKAIEEQQKKAEEEEEAKRKAIEEQVRKAKEEADKRAADEQAKEEAKKRAIEEQVRKAKDAATKAAMEEDQRLKDAAATRALEELQKGAMMNKMAEEQALELAAAASLNSKGTGDGTSSEHAARIKAEQDELLRKANIQRDLEIQKQDAQKRLEREQEKAKYRAELARNMHEQDSPHAFVTPKRVSTTPELTDEIKRKLDAQNARRKRELADLETQYESVRKKLHEAREKAAEFKRRSGVAPSETSAENENTFRLEYCMPRNFTHIVFFHMHVFVFCAVFHTCFIHAPVFAGLRRMWRIQQFLWRCDYVYVLLFMYIHAS